MKPIIESDTMQIPKQLFQAIIDGKTESVEDLIRSGVNVNAKGDNGYTALHVVTGLGSTDPVVDMAILKLLIDSGADVNAKTDDGDTSLHNAAAWRSVEFVEFLVSSGADARAENVYGVTPLNLAWIRYEDEKTKENAAVHEYLSGVVNNEA